MKKTGYEKQKTWRKRHPEDYRRQKRESERRHPEKVAARRKMYKEKHREQLLADKLRKRTETREYVDGIKWSRGCAICGENEPCALDFHHMEGKEINIAATRYWRISRIQEEIDKCVVICASCHRKLHAGLYLIE